MEVSNKKNVIKQELKSVFLLTQSYFIGAYLRSANLANQREEEISG